MTTRPPDPPPLTGTHSTGSEPADGPVVAAGYQAALLPAPAIRRPRWRAVLPDGTRLPPVGQLGAVIAQATTIARDRGTAWIVGPGDYTIEITRTAHGLQVTATEPEPRWVRATRTAVERTALPSPAAAPPHPAPAGDPADSR